MDDVVYILTRTSNRPNYFKINRKSIEEQTYENIRHIVTYDDKNDLQYLKDYKNIERVYLDKKLISLKKDIPDPKTGARSIHNLYFNELHPYLETDGWVLILDDDDYLINEDVIKILVNKVAYKTDLVIHQMEYKNKHRLPSATDLYKKPRLGRIGSPCVFCHTSIFRKIKWDGWKCGDYRFIEKLWRLTERKIWINQPLIKIGSNNGNLGRRNDTTIKEVIITNKLKIPKQRTVDDLKLKKINYFKGKKTRVTHLYLIPSYNRFNKLIKQIETIRSFYFNDGEYRIIICNDASTDSNYENLKKQKDIVYLENKNNNGKEKYWKTINKGFLEASKYTFDYLIQLDDDFEISNKLNFFLYQTKITENLAAIKLHNDQREIVWQKKQWVDGGTAYTENFLKKIAFTIDEIPKVRWLYNKNLSSGVWQQVTEKINKFNLQIINPEFSLLKHNDDNHSKMNSYRNLLNYEIKTKNFKNIQVPIVMCAWQRLENFEKTITLLKDQTYKNWALYIWNNNIDNVNNINKIVDKYKSKLNIIVFHSEKNVGGFGRFLMAKKISNLYKKIIFIDDDQTFDSLMISRFLKNYKPKTVRSWWSWKINDAYYNRIRAKHNETADYCGTGGMICDINLFKNKSFYNIPKEYLFIEDLWLSYYASQKLKWELYGCENNIKIINDGKDQYVKIGNKKNEFLQKLKTYKWDEL